MKIRDYELCNEPIGVGGMGCVYKAYHVNLGVYRAIKELKTDMSVSAEVVRRFLQEARIQVQLKHPNIVEVFDCFEEDGKFYIVMEFIEGITLKTLVEGYYKLKSNRNISPEFERVVLDTGTCAGIISQSLDALYYAHSHNTIHRDIKPANILLTPDANDYLHVKLADFGIAKYFHSDEDKLTKTGMALGTVHYMAPEQIAPEEFGTFDHRADIYAMGIMLFELLTGTYPFGDRATSEIKVLTNKMSDIMPNLIKYRDILPGGYYDCIEKAIKHNPKERFQDALEFKEAILPLRRNDYIPTADVPAEHTSTGYIDTHEIIPEDITPKDLGVEISAVDRSAINGVDIVTPDKQPTRQGNKRIYVVLAVVLACIAMAALWWIVYREDTPKEQKIISVPDQRQPETITVPDQKQPAPQQAVPKSDTATETPVPVDTQLQEPNTEDKADDTPRQQSKPETPVKKTTLKRKAPSYITPAGEEIIKKK
ncbi:Serine/threonine protein kinase domain protein [Candidatus Magnetobacterium bavaricum]|uniref:Serine/threonine protein kinase domain protein n=1 Tax=Candidatus Magnetobacterium bavaricum TaxID=29290 RepID=A0A0F3GSD6_9BACT|nr:Serine/threonine protein kinase domain protein [Candidatus Magnetobacterium bavaricum]